MGIKDTRRDQLRVLLHERGGVVKDLAATLRKAPAQVSQWLNGHRTITEESAREIERTARKPLRWLDGDNAGSSHGPASFSYSLHDAAAEQRGYHTPVGAPPQPDTDDLTIPASEIAWEDLVSHRQLPRVFLLRLRDNAMAPRAPAGDRLEMTTGLSPQPGDGVLVRDQRGHVMVRIYHETTPGHWVAKAVNADAYSPIDGDELEVLAVVTGKMSSGRWS